ncbi:hypothetical protein LN42_07315 [Marinitoga sp. 1137]|uniref:hypothetical protein n=1 Tax=Marinitoga sp. 1137 TaxID=1545835 RepID=UPI0009509EE8|nr:hypothetical protein [Marinitoga sp. 1137]APT76212.1 hypothetical protein LN42_07315 [Marinitoga sp. 1137]
MKRFFFLFFLIVLAIVSFSINYGKIDQNRFVLRNIKEYADKHWCKIETKNIIFHFEKDSEFARYSRIIAEREQQNLDKLFDFFKLKNVKNKANVYILKDFEMNNIIDVGGLNTGGSTIYTTSWALRHELIHFVEAQFEYEKYQNEYKKDKIHSEILVESIPQYFTSGYNTAYLKFIFKYGKKLDFDNPDKMLKEMAKNDNIYAYGSSFFEYMLQHYTIDEIKNLYINYFTNIEDISGKNFDELIGDWLKWVKNYSGNSFNGIYAANYFYYLYYENYIIGNIQLQNIYNLKGEIGLNYNNQIVGRINNSIAVYDLFNKRYSLYNGRFLSYIDNNYVITYNYLADYIIINIYNKNTGLLIHKIPLEVDKPALIKGDILDNIFVFSTGYEIYKYNLNTGKLQKIIDNINTDVVKRIGNKLLLGNEDGTVSIFENNKITKSIKISDWFIKHIIPAENYIIVTSGFNKITILDKNTLKIVKELFLENDYLSQISNNKNYLYVLYLSGKILKIDLNTFKTVNIMHVGRVAYPEIGYLTKNLFAKNIDGYLRFYALDYTIPENKELYRKIRSLKDYPDYIENEKLLFKTENNINNYWKIGDYEIIENEFCEVSIKKDGNEILNIELFDYLSNLKIIKDILFISCNDGEVRLYNLKNGKELFEDQKLQLSADFDGDYIYYGNKNREIVKYDYKNKKIVEKYYGNWGLISEIKRTPDNKTMISYYSKDKFKRFTTSPSNRIIIHYNDKPEYDRTIVIRYPVKTIIPYSSDKLLVEDTKSNLYIYNIFTGNMEKIISHSLRKIISLDIYNGRIIFTDGKFILIKDINTNETIAKYITDYEHITFVKWISNTTFIYGSDNKIYSYSF